MREILFKAKRTDNGEWVEGHYYSQVYHEGTIEEEWYHFIKPIGSESWESIRVKPETICQYTGLTDKNGRKIWENDIVVRVDRRNGIYIFREQPKMNCKVIWSDRHGFDTVPSCGYFDKNNALECEVIGNIFDNQELLKGGWIPCSERLPEEPGGKSGF